MTKSQSVGENQQKSAQEPQTSTFHTISQGGEAVKKIEFITRIQINGVKEEVSGAKASEIVRERVENALQAMNYERKAAG